MPHPLKIRMEYDGKMFVYDEWTGPNGQREHANFMVTNVNHLRDARHFLASL